MRSTTLVALRALIMLACLVAVPLVAVFGTSMKDWFGDSDQHKPVTPVPVAEDEHEPEAANFSAAVEDPYAQPPVNAVPDREPLEGRSPLLTTAASRGPLAVGGRAPIVPHNPRPVVPQEPDTEPAAPPPRREEAIDPESRGQPSAEAAPAQPEREADPQPSRVAQAGMAAASDQSAAPDFVQIQQRLQELGATYYRLETWGKRQLFRFHCRMAIRPDSPYTRHFEATDTDPLKAMQRVLDQIESWRQGQDGQ